MIFKPEMFEEVLEVKADKQWLMEYVAKTANVLLREHLLTATVVYCDKDELHFSGVDEIGYTHKGYLIGVEEIKKEEDGAASLVPLVIELEYALETSLAYLNWREDDLIGDDCIGDGKLTAQYKNRVATIKKALQSIEKFLEWK